MFAEPVENVLTTGENFLQNVVINAKIFKGVFKGKLLQSNIISFKSSNGISKTALKPHQNHIFEDNLVNYVV